MRLLILTLIGCAEPVPYTNSSMEEPSATASTSRPSPAANAQRPSIGDGECRATQFWSSQIIEDETVLVQGAIASQKEVSVPYLVDVVSVEKNSVVFGLECSTQSSFTATLPANLGDVWLLVFADLDGNGPSETDPHGASTQILVKEENLQGVAIEVGGRIIPEAFQLAPPNGAGSDNATPADASQQDPATDTKPLDSVETTQTP